jgi:LPS export ABC transporter protein LptC
LDISDYHRGNSKQHDNPNDQKNLTKAASVIYLACNLPLQAFPCVVIFDMKKVLFLLSVVGLLAILTLFFFQDSDIKGRLHLGDNSYMEDVSIVQKKGGVTSFVVNAQKAVFVTASDVQLTALNIFFPEKALTLTSESGVYNTESRDLKIEGNIKATTKDYDIVTTKLRWDAAKNQLFSDDKVTIVGKRFYVEGEDLTATNDTATLHKNVKAVFNGK